MKATTEDLEAIRNSGLFDADWYVEQYPDVKVLGIDPLEHYLWLGGQLKRNPSPKFDSASYLAANPDVARGRMNPLLHLVRWAKNEPWRKISIDHSTNIEEKPVSEENGWVIPRENSNQAPHYGMSFHRLVQEASQRALPGEKTEEFEIIKAHFDMAYYLRRYADIANAQINPIHHFMQHGAKEGRDPTPTFVTKYYTNRYPDVATSGLNPFYHYLTVGRKEGRGTNPYSAGEPNFEEMCEILGRRSSEVQQNLLDRRRDLRGRLEHGVLGEMVKRAAQLEPLIHHTWLAAMEARFPPFHSEPIMGQIAAMHRLQKAAGWRRAKVVVAIRSCGVSGAARIAGHLATALEGIYGAEEIVVLCTDQSDMLFPEWFPSGARHVDLPRAALNVSQVNQQRLLVEFIRSLRPDAVFNINSKLFWDMLLPYGKALSKSTSLYAYLFCDDMNTFGYIDGYPSKQFYRYFDLYKAILADSHFLADSLRERFQIPPSQTHKLLALGTPVSGSIPIAPPIASGTRRPQIFWSGRFDRQKRVDIVAELAARLPDVDFRLWGQPGVDKHFERLTLPANISTEGVYKQFSELPLSEADLWLYTSQWDGVPNVLFEVAAAGIPLVGSLAGGCGEVLIEGLSERIEDVEDVAAFEVAIRRVLADPKSARERAILLRERILTDRAQKVYRSQIETLLQERSSE